MEGIQCSGFTFYNQFDSANLGKVVLVPPHESPVTLSTNVSGKTVPEIPNAEFNIWTKPDCCGTEFENGNRTWFYFGIKAQEPCLLVRLNIVDLNRQGKMYSQGMAPVYRIIPGKLQWDRIRDKPTYNTTDDIFTLSFKFKTPENVDSITYFAFTYPFSYNDLEKMLTNIDLRFQNYLNVSEDDIYYKKEVVCHSLGGRDVHLITISSYHGITSEVETRLKHLFPDTNVERPKKFIDKKFVFISARVHPGETPSSFVFNGFLNLLLTKDDPIAIMLRRLYVFKLIPFLNPDGVALGHYRTDTRGINLNRVYLNPLLSQHPSIYAARALILYYHFGHEIEEKVSSIEDNDNTVQNDNNISSKVLHMTLEEPKKDNMWCLKCKNLMSADGTRLTNNTLNDIKLDKSFYIGDLCSLCKKINNKETVEIVNNDMMKGDVNLNESGLYLYLDLHGHASKKGIFMYGNHFDDVERSVECMLLPKLMSLNNHNFHFTACNFTERNMYLKDRRDGMSREGSGRVAVLKLTGLTKSYTLECNYNTGRFVNVLPPTIKEPHMRVHSLPVPPKFTPQIFEEVGKSLGASILDLTSQNPCTRIPNSEFHTISGLKDWLRINCSKEVEPQPPPKIKLRSLAGLHNQGKTTHGKARSATVKSIPKRLVTRVKSSKVPVEKKENVVVTAGAILMTQPSCSYSEPEQRTASKSALRLKKNVAIKSRTIKDFSQKHKRGGTSGDKQKLNRLKVKTTLTSQRSRLQRKQTIEKGDKNNEHEGNSAKFSEILYLKAEATTKFKVEDMKMNDTPGDCIEMTWKPGNTSQTYHYKRVKKLDQTIVSCKSNSEAGPSSKPASYQGTTFGKSSTFPKCKFKKHSLRRLTSATETRKVEKVKNRKKIKSK